MDFSELTRDLRFSGTFLAGLLVLIFVLFSLEVADRQGASMAQDAMHGIWRPTGSWNPQRGMVNFLFSGDAHAIPPQVRIANADGNLVLIDDTADHYVVSIVQSSPAARGSMYWIDRKSVTSVAFAYPAEPATFPRRPPAPPPSSTTMVVNVVTVALGCVFLLLMVRWSHAQIQRRRRQRGKLRAFATDEIEALDLPSTDLVTIFATLRRGVDVLLRIIEPGCERLYYLRGANYQNLALVLDETPEAEPVKGPRPSPRVSET